MQRVEVRINNLKSVGRRKEQNIKKPEEGVTSTYSSTPNNKVKLLSVHMCYFLNVCFQNVT